MKIKIYILLLFVCLKLKSQNNEIGLGVGTLNFINPSFEFYYSFQYKLIYTQVNMMYAPTKTEYYKSLTHYAAFLGIQTLPTKKSRFHFAMGARYLTPQNYYVNGELDKSHTNPQTNFFILSGYSYNISKHHSFFVDLLIGGMKLYKEYRSYEDYEPIPDIRLSLGYAFNFGNKKIDKE